MDGKKGGFVLLVLCFGAVTAARFRLERIVGGSVTTIDRYPAIAALLQSTNLVTFSQDCGSSILNERSILTAAHCFTYDNPAHYRVRVGSTWSNSGGVVYNTASIIIHPDYSTWTFDSDLAILRTATAITFSSVVQQAAIAGPNYIAPDYEVVWAAGWGATASGAAFSEQLRHVQYWTISRAVCTQQYSWIFTDNMMCAGVPDVGGLSTCQGDSGGPLYHHGTVIGIVSFGGSVCGDPNQHGVYVLVSRFTPWIQANA